MPPFNRSSLSRTAFVPRKISTTTSHPKSSSFMPTYPPSEKSSLPSSEIPIFTTVASYRQWRTQAFREGRSVGFVPTMGALHEGHLSLVRRSLSENDLTVLSIFVNPAQFTPHEDLERYPRTLSHDLEVLAEQRVEQVASELNNSNPSLKSNHVKRPSAVFLPSVSEMYPSGIDQEIEKQRGTFIQFKDLGDDEMEGKSRPGFFRGVATVVTKLFNVVQPTNAYFGQKDIQQALLLRRMVTDLLLSQPLPQNLHIVPTARDPSDNLALSSRNAYLTPVGRRVAPTLYEALKAAEECWFAQGAGRTKKDCVEAARELVRQRIASAYDKGLDVQIKLDYIEMNNSGDFKPLEDCATCQSRKADGTRVILSGAMWIDGTRLIDNLLLSEGD